MEYTINYKLVNYPNVVSSEIMLSVEKIRELSY